MTSQRSSSPDDELVWSPINYSMRDFVEAFGFSLPALIKITSGYAGFDEGMHQIGFGELYWVHDIQRQKRIVVQPEKSNCYLSIPTEYLVKVQIFHEGSKKMSPPVPVRDVLDVLSKRSSQVKMMFENNQPVSFQIGADLGSTAKLGVLTVLHTYEEKYLLANSIFQRSIFPDTRGIPVYLPIEFVTAEALKTGGTNALTLWMKDITKTMETYKRAPVRMCQDLILFSELPSDGEYEYMKLTDFSNFKEKDKIYSALIIKRHNSDDSNPNKPKSLGLAHELAQSASSSNNHGIDIPRLPAPFSPSVLPSPAVGNTSFSAEKCTADSSRHAKTSKRPVPLPPAKGGPPAVPVQYTPSHGFTSVPPISSPKSTKNDQLNYEPIVPVSPTPIGTYKSLSQIPATVDFGKLAIEQVVDCLRLMHLEHHAETFRARSIDGTMALRLTEEMLVKDFNFQSFDAMQFLMFVKEGWRPNEDGQTKR